MQASAPKQDSASNAVLAQALESLQPMPVSSSSPNKEAVKSKGMKNSNRYH